MIEIYNEIEDAVLIFPNEASLEIFQESGVRTFITVLKPSTKTSKLAASAMVED